MTGHVTTTTDPNRDPIHARGHELSGPSLDRYLIACLTGNGIGPEVMAEASRVLAQVSQLHGFVLEETHQPFGAEAMARSGHPLPAATRYATVCADAILVAGATEPALDAVKEELHLAASVTRVLRESGGGLTLFAPLETDSVEWTIERAFESSRAARGRLVSVGVSAPWKRLVKAGAERHAGVDVVDVPLAQALKSLTLGTTDLEVVLTEQALADALVGAPSLAADGRRMRASGSLSPIGPGLYGPTHGSAHDIAGKGVANPSEMLLAASLMLGEGLGRRAAAQTLEAGLGEALRRPARTPDLAGPGRAATTREFVDVVIEMLATVRRDTEFALGGA